MSELTVEHRLLPGARAYHVVAGAPDWEPAADEMKELADLFQSALLESSGAVVVTRIGVEVREITPPASTEP